MATPKSRLNAIPLALDGLSHRELQILELAASGLTNGDIAQSVGVSVHAVKFHLASVYRKLGVANRTEAAVTYFRATTMPVTARVQESS